MINIKLTIINLLNERFSPLGLKVQDESHLHRGGANAQSHYKVELISASFAQQTMLQRHRAVYQCLATVMPKIHALALHLYSPDERQADEVAQSPSGEMTQYATDKITQYANTPPSSPSVFPSSPIAPSPSSTPSSSSPLSPQPSSSSPSVSPPPSISSPSSVSSPPSPPCVKKQKA